MKEAIVEPSVQTFVWLIVEFVQGRPVKSSIMELMN